MGTHHTHMSGNTATGPKYELFVESLLTKSGIKFKRQANVGYKRNDGSHRVDLLVEKTLVSLKSQQVAGTAEQKIPFEIMVLQHAIEDYKYDNAIIVLHGDTGWKWKHYYLSTEFKSTMGQLYPDVSIMSHEQFVSIYS
jgi:hypothetical protein